MHNGALRDIIIMDAKRQILAQISDFLNSGASQIQISVSDPETLPRGSGSRSVTCLIWIRIHTPGPDPVPDPNAAQFSLICTGYISAFYLGNTGSHTKKLQQ